MSQFRSEARPAGQPSAVKVAPCPCVADLIDFAQGRIGLEERQRIEVHLQKTGCSHCRSWISKSTALAATPLDPPSRNSHPALTTDSTKWQRQAFSDLEKRLQQLDEG